MTKLHDNWKWPTGWKSVHLPTDTDDDFKLEMEIAEMLSEWEERDPKAYAEWLKTQQRRNDQPQAPAILLDGEHPG